MHPLVTLYVDDDEEEKKIERKCLIFLKDRPISSSWLAGLLTDWLLFMHEYTQKEQDEEQKKCKRNMSEDDWTLPSVIKEKSVTENCMHIPPYIQTQNNGALVKKKFWAHCSKTLNRIQSSFILFDDAWNSNEKNYRAATASNTRTSESNSSSSTRKDGREKKIENPSNVI